MGRDEIETSLFEIEQMVLVAVSAQESLFASDTDSEIFQMPKPDCEMLSFSVFDILKRVRSLRSELYPWESAKVPVLTLVRPLPDLSA
jgi:hypothetical protein